jgi:hypothetical protein
LRPLFPRAYLPLWANPLKPASNLLLESSKMKVEIYAIINEQNT